MKKFRFTMTQIVNIPHESQSGLTPEEPIRKHGNSKGTFSKRRAAYRGMDASALYRLKELGEENRRLKRMQPT
jgi:putative transposase